MKIMKRERGREREEDKDKLCKEKQTEWQLGTTGQISFFKSKYKVNKNASEGYTID